VLDVPHDAHAEAEGEAPGSLSPDEPGYWLWWVKQPTLDLVPIGVFLEPPPSDTEGNIGAVYLGNDEDATVAGVNVGRLAYRTTKLWGRARRALEDLLP